MLSAPLWFTQLGKTPRGKLRVNSRAPKPLKQVCLRVPWQPLHVDDHPEVTSCGVTLRLFGVWSPEDQPYAWYTFSQDPSGRERKRLERVLGANSSRLKKLVVDCPRPFDVRWLEETLRDHFPHVESCQYVSSHLGAITARRRSLSFCWRDASPPPIHLDRYLANPPPSMQMIPLDGGAVAEDLCVEGTLTQEPGIVTTGDPWLPHPFGHIRGPGVPPKCLVHKVSGPACAFIGPTRDIKGPGATLIPSGAGTVRRLSLGEIARAPPGGLMALAGNNGRLLCPGQVSLPSCKVKRGSKSKQTRTGSFVSWFSCTSTWGAPPKGSSSVCRGSVTCTLLAWLRAYLQGSNRPAEEKAALWASLCLGWFYACAARQ